MKGQLTARDNKQFIPTQIPHHVLYVMFWGKSGYFFGIFIPSYQLLVQSQR